LLFFWQKTFYSNNFYIITLRIKDESRGLRIINIHNVYNPPPKSHNEDENLSIFVYLSQTIRMLNEYIILKDFNFYYLL
jgi:hypothetical protein